MICFNGDDIVAARRGNRVALEAVVRTAERPIFNLAIRMLAHRADAEDATQEILIKLVTHLGSLREVEAAGGWAMRIAVRHLLEMRKRGRIEAMRLTFKAFAADLETGLAPLQQAGLSDAEAALALEEVKIGCTLAMLTCLTREARVTYLLGDVFEMPDTAAASVLEISAQAYRQRLSRARRAVQSFVATRCGLVAKDAPCRCDRRVCAAITCGRVQCGRSAFNAGSRQPADLDALRTQIGRLEDGRRAAALMRSNPEFTSRISALVAQLV